MALNTFRGSGKFVPDTEWSCPIHERPEYHECDCHLCTWTEPECCANAKWVEKRDESGEIVMRETSVWEEMMVSNVAASLGSFSDFLSGKRETAKIEWLEDEAAPKIQP